jgi:tetratricopeptide (TPR) repeat protein
MKKTVSLMLTAMLAAQCLMAQLPDGIKFLNYDKLKSAKEAFQKAYDANPKDGQNVYWLGQALMATDGGDPTKEQVATAKALYQKSLGELGSDPWLLVGMGHVGILTGEDMNSVKQKFEQAITATTETKGKNKGKPNPAILNAIGRANAYVTSNLGDHAYAVDKLKQAGAIDLTNPDIYINMGINYLKMGGENGGEAVKAYQEAINRDPKNAKAMYRTGKIYQSQNNKDLFEKYFNDAIAADPAFPPVYYAFYEYYANKDVVKAKEYLDKFVANADKDPANDLYLADYLFRAGKNAESLAKVKELDASVGSKTLPKLDILYALNYDRIGDSVQAKSYLKKYFENAPADIMVPGDYELAVKVFSKFPGSETQAVTYLEKAMNSDTSRVNKINYANQAADLFAKAKMFPQQMQWIQKAVALKGGVMGEADYYKITSSAFNAKDYPQTIALAKTYMTAFPDKPQPYSFFKRATFASDPDTVGASIDNINYLDSIYTLVDKEKYKKDIFLNQYYIMKVYLKKMSQLNNSPDFKITSAGVKTPTVEEYLVVAQKVVTVLDSMGLLYPDPNDENNKFVQNTKADIQKRIDYYSKPPVPGKKTGGGGGAAGKG